MMELIGVGLLFTLFMTIVFVIPVWLLMKWNDEEPKQ
jgi:hypothetical protein